MAHGNIRYAHEFYYLHLPHPPPARRSEPPSKLNRDYCVDIGCCGQTRQQCRPRRVKGHYSGKSYAEDGIEGSIEMESVRSHRGKTSLIASAVGLPSLTTSRPADEPRRHTYRRSLSVGSTAFSTNRNIFY